MARIRVLASPLATLAAPIRLSPCQICQHRLRFSTAPPSANAQLPASPTSLELSAPRYHVARSANKNLPIYTDYKRGGNLHLTTVRKITGDLSALRDELRVYLNKKNEDVKINSLTGHVIVKGHHTARIKQFLEARGM